MRIAIEKTRIDTSYNQDDVRVLTLNALVEMTSINKQSVSYYFETGQLPAVRIAVDPITKKPYLEPRMSEKEIFVPYDVGMRFVQYMNEQEVLRQEAFDTPIHIFANVDDYLISEATTKFVYLKKEKTFINIDESFYLRVLQAAQEVKDEYMRDNPGEPPVVTRKCVRKKMGIGNNPTRYREIMSILNTKQHLEQFPPRHIAQVARDTIPYDVINIIRGLNNIPTSFIPRSYPPHHPYKPVATKED